MSRHKRGLIQCRPSRRLVEVFDQCLERVRIQVDESVTLDDQTVENVQLTGTTVTGLRNFRRTQPITCICLADRIRIFLYISFLDVTVTWLVTVLDGELVSVLSFGFLARYKLISKCKFWIAYDRFPLCTRM